MKGIKKMRKWKIGLMSVCIGALLGGTITAMTPNEIQTQAAGVSFANNLFDYASGDFSVSYHQKGSEITVGDGSTPFVNDQKAGVLFESKKTGASAIGSQISFTQEFVGRSEFDFRVFSENTYSEYLESGKKKGGAGAGIWGAYAENWELDLKELAFTFTDTNSGAAFTVYMAGGQDWASSLVAMRVGAGKVGENTGAGLNYSDAAVTNGVYKARFNTTLRGTTFCNACVSEPLDSNVKSISTNTKSTAFGFDPASMQIYGYSHGIKVNNTQKILVADLSDETNIINQGAENAYVPFENYTVTVTLTDVAVARTPKLLIYSVNGQSLAGENGKMTDNSGASASASIQARAISGQSYKLPAVQAFDIMDGAIGYQGEVCVKQGDTVLLEKQAYSAGLSFTPNGTEDCKIILSGVKDKKGNIFLGADGQENESVYTVETLAQVPEMEIVDSASETWLYGRLAPVGAKGVSELYYPNKTPNMALEIKKDGNTVESVETVSESTAYAFASAGEYELHYKATDYFGNQTTLIKDIIIQQNSVEMKDQALANNRYFSIESLDFSADDVLVIDGLLGEVIQKDVQISVKKSSSGGYTPYIEEQKASLFAEIGEYTLLYEISYDANGVAGTAQVERTVEIVDVTAPIITISGTIANTKTMESTNPAVEGLKAICGEIGIPTATATDDFDKALGGVQAQIITPSGIVHALSLPCNFNCEESGVYNLSYTSTDASGNLSVKAYQIDVRARWIELKDTEQRAETAGVGTSTSFENVRIVDINGATVQGTISVSYAYNGIAVNKAGKVVSFDKIGQYDIIVSAIVGDERVEKGYKVIVVDQNKPTISLQGEAPTKGKIGEQISLPKAICKDGEDGELACEVFVEINGQRTQIYDYALLVKEECTATVIYEVKDYSGNTASLSYEIAFSQKGGGCSGSVEYGVVAFVSVIAVCVLFKRKKYE